MSEVYCIIGLGNPGAKYHESRHNIGFRVVDKLAEFFKIESFEFENNYLYAVSEYKEKQIVLLKPLTYMNSSGRAVRDFYEKYEISADKLLVVYDDVNLDFGTLRIRPSGSDGGQNGIKSVIYEMQTDEIPRLRVGIKNDAEFEKFRNDEDKGLADFVLSGFTDDEYESIDKVTEAAKDAVMSYINDGIAETMNKFNRDFLSNENN